MLYFNGNIKGHKILLNWATASEKDFDFFTIERSSDAENFTAIGKIQGNGNSNNIQKYIFADHSALKGKSYYRLKATDFDGSVEYHKIIMLEYKTVSSSFSIFPNPLEGQTFTLKSDLKIDEQSIIRIYNTVGVEVLHKKGYEKFFFV